MNDYKKSLSRVSNLIELLITCHPNGFNILLGVAPPPTSQEIHEMLNTTRVPMPEDFRPVSRSNETEAERIVYDVDYFNETVQMAKGWPHIYKISQDFKSVNQRFWNATLDHVKFVSYAPSRYMSKLGYVAARYGLSPRTVSKYRREFPLRLAEVILMPQAEDEDFYLLPG